MERNAGVVLIVDDVPDNIVLLTRALDEVGYVVLTETAGEDAIRAVQRTCPDIVLLDAAMPGLDGFSVCQRIKQMHHAAHVPVIFMTALTETADVLRGFSVGAADYVTKPIQIDEVLARIATHLTAARHLTRVRNALENSGQALLIVDTEGNLVWHSSRAADVLKHHETGSTQTWPWDAIAMKEWLKANASNEPMAWMPAPASSDGHSSLVARITGRFGNDEVLIELMARAVDTEFSALVSQFNLTAREAEVLLWSTRGKTSRDIGSILNISPRTADKHLEHVYVKMGVETRTAAVAMALRVTKG